MRDYYYFADQVPTVNLNDYESPEQLIVDLRVQPHDKFSYVTTIEQYQNYFDAGTSFGFGFSWKRDSEDEARLSQVYPDSPFGRAGAARGDIIVSLNGRLWNETNNDQFFEAIGTDEAPKITTWILKSTVNDQEKTLVVQQETFNINTVIHHQTFRTPEYDGNIGYMVLRGFIENTEPELEAVFADFKNQNVQELILDLRYNGGGRTRLARMLASLIAGPDTNEKLLIEYRNNSKYTDRDISRYFINEPNALNLKRVLIITTSRTASSSEIVINSLKPYIDVVTIGERTTGKPYITYSNEKCDRSMNALAAEGFNANGVSVLGGIAPTCNATDNPVQDFPLNDIVNNIDDADSMVGSAIDYLNTGTCGLPQPIVASIRSKSSGPTVNMEDAPALADGF